MGKTSFAYDTPQQALNAFLERITPVDHQTVNWTESFGRVLAEPIIADRDSPSCDVSAMDGYAARIGDLSSDWIAVEGEAAIGRPRATLATGKAMRIFTGGPIPYGADAVIMREQTEEQPDRMRLHEGVTIEAGKNIRFQGENVAAGQTIVESGTVIDPQITTAAASFGYARLKVHRPIRVGLLVTGNELCSVEQAVQPWQLRDSNGPALQSLLGRHAWIQVRSVRQVEDVRSATITALQQCLDECDAVLISGGVSMGDHDYVPEAVRQVGCDVAFHKLPIRPGKPLLAAWGPQGQVVMGLPGNPVSVMVTAVRFAMPALARRAGSVKADRPAPKVEIVNPDQRTLKLWWYRGVQWQSSGRVKRIESKGSGDLVAAAQCDGFVEIPPGQTVGGWFAYYPWR